MQLTAEPPCNALCKGTYSGATLPDFAIVLTCVGVHQSLRVRCAWADDMRQMLGGLCLTCTQANVCQQALLEPVCCLDDIANCKQRRFTRMRITLPSNRKQRSMRVMQQGCDVCLMED